MLKLHKYSLLILFVLSCLIGTDAFAQNDKSTKQQTTKVKGKVIDKETKEPLPFVNVFFVGATIGTTTDFDGNFSMSTQWGTDELGASFVGYKTQNLKVEIGKNNNGLLFELESSTATLGEVTVKAKRRRYKRRNNPAVSLIKKVMDNKDANRIRGQDYFEYDKYEKVELDINNLTDKFKNRKVFNKFEFIWDHVDTSDINGKPYLPVYIQETSSKLYFRKKPRTNREHRYGVQMSGLDEYWDNEGVVALMDVLYQDINVYDNKIKIIDLEFVSPLSNLGVAFYRYYIIDTIQHNGREVIDLAFMPANKNDLGFTGNLYITNDSAYTVTRAELDIMDQINMNWVDDLKIEQEFDLVDGVWVLNVDKMVIDFRLAKKGIGFYGKKSNIYSNHIFNTPRDASIYNTSIKIKDDLDVLSKPPEFWEEKRPIPLSKDELAVYNMIDTIQTIPAFRNAMDILKLALTGYYTFGPVDVGPINGIYSFNDIEGGRLRIGGETNLDFHPKLQLEGTLIYGFGDEKFKYSGAAEYSFNKNFEMNPRHRVRVSYQHDTNFPGQSLAFVNEDNFLLSFKRGIVDKLLFFDAYRVDYLKEFRNDFSYNLLFERKWQEPLGSLKFRYNDGADSLSRITTTEFGLNLRWAPNEEYVQGRDFRYAIFNKYPVFTLKYGLGLKDVLGGDYNYQRVTLNVFKKFNFSVLGFAHINLEGGKTFGEVPFLLMNLPRANQTYSYQTYSYNMMNFLEFVSDEFVSLNIRYYMNGFIFNKIPLIKRLKLREIVSFKALYGRISDSNNPDLDDQLIQLPVRPDGSQSTFIMEGGIPYIEGSVGISNIFKVLTFDLVKRMTYLDKPNQANLFGVKGLGLRFRVGFEF